MSQQLNISAPYIQQLNINILNRSFIYRGENGYGLLAAKSLFKAFLAPAKFTTVKIHISEMNKDTDVDQIKLLNLNECADYLTSLSFTTDINIPEMMNKMFDITSHVRNLTEFEFQMQETFMRVSYFGESKKDGKEQKITQERMKHLAGIIQNNQNLSKIKITIDKKNIESPDLLDVLFAGIFSLEHLTSINLTFYEVELSDEQTLSLFKSLAKLDKLTDYCINFKNFGLYLQNKILKLIQYLSKKTLDMQLQLAQILLSGVKYTEFKI